MSEKLKPCPFCGSTDTDVLRSTDGVKFWGRCETCGAVGGVGSTDEEAVNNWNRRNGGAEMSEEKVTITIQHEEGNVITDINGQISDRYLVIGAASLARSVLRETGVSIEDFIAEVLNDDGTSTSGRVISCSCPEEGGAGDD